MKITLEKLQYGKGDMYGAIFEDGNVIITSYHKSLGEAIRKLGEKVIKYEKTT